MAENCGSMSTVNCEELANQPDIVGFLVNGDWPKLDFNQNLTAKRILPSWSPCIHIV